MDVQKNIHELLIEFKKTKDGYTIPLLGDNGKLNWVSVKNPKMRDSDLFRRINNTVKMLEDTCFEPTFELVTFLDIFGSRVVLHAPHLPSAEIFILEIAARTNVFRRMLEPLEEFSVPSSEEIDLQTTALAVTKQIISNEEKDQISPEISKKRKTFSRLLIKKQLAGFPDQVVQTALLNWDQSFIPAAQIEYFKELEKALDVPTILTQMLSSPTSLVDAISNPAKLIESVFKRVRSDSETDQGLLQKMRQLRQDPTFDTEQFLRNNRAYYMSSDVMSMAKDKLNAFLNRGANLQQTLETGGPIKTPNADLKSVFNEDDNTKIDQALEEVDKMMKVTSTADYLKKNGLAPNVVLMAFQEAGLESTLDNCKAVAREYCRKIRKKQPPWQTISF